MTPQEALAFCRQQQQAYPQYRFREIGDAIQQMMAEDLRPYLRSGNNIPVTRATIPWPDIGMVTVDAIRGRR